MAQITLATGQFQEAVLPFFPPIIILNLNHLFVNLAMCVNRWLVYVHEWVGLNSCGRSSY